MLTIRLAKWDPPPLSCYKTRGGKPAPLPARMAWLHPGALAAIRPLTDRLVLSDCYRDPQTQRDAYAKAVAVGNPMGRAPVCRSGHPWGICVDLDVRATLRRMDAVQPLPLARNKRDLDAVMLSAGWCCFRADHRDAREWHHYTWGTMEDGQRGVLEAIERAYPGSSVWTLSETQGMLDTLGHETGAPGWGPKCRAALTAFRASVGVPTGPRRERDTFRALALWTATVEREVV